MENAGSSAASNAQLINVSYVISISGILKIAQCILGLVTFICAASDARFTALGGGWVLFVSMTSFLVTLSMFLTYILFLAEKIPPRVPVDVIEIIVNGTYVLFYFISGVVAAVRGSLSAAVAACAFFAFATMVSYAVDTVYKFLIYRRVFSDSSHPSAPANTTSTNTMQSTPNFSQPISITTPGMASANSAGNDSQY